MIIGERVRLRGIERQDIAQFVTWLNDREVTENLLLNLPVSRAEEEGWFERMLQRPMEEHPKAIEVKTADGWVFVGNIGFHDLDWVHRTVEVGLFIGEKKYWNQGFGSEAMRLMLEHGFNDLNLNRIYLHVYDTNPRGMRAYEKAGYKKEGVLRQAVFKNGRYHDVIVMSVLRDEWKPEQK